MRPVIETLGVACLSIGLITMCLVLSLAPALLGTLAYLLAVNIELDMYETL